MNATPAAAEHLFICVDGVLQTVAEGRQPATGVFTTLRTFRGDIPDLPEHRARLADQATALGLAPPPALGALIPILTELLAANALAGGDARLRLAVGPPTPSTPVIWTAITSALPAALETWRHDGIDVVTLGAEFDRGAQARLKVLGLATQQAALAAAAKAACPDAIVCNAAGRALEGAISNLFLVFGKELVTPPDDGTILAGITRGRILQLASDLGLRVQQRSVDRSRLSQAAEIFLTNSVRDVLPVVTVDGERIGAGRPGDLTLRLQAEYRDRYRPARA